MSKSAAMEWERAEQEALNQRWAQESQNELVLMSVFGVGTSLPVIYLIYLAFAVDVEFARRVLSIALP